jgi:putative PEP-CTERM system histidine kinase
MSLELEYQPHILSNIGLYSYGTALLAYIMLTILASITRRNNRLGGAVLAASSLTALWAAVVMLSSVSATPHVMLIMLTEVTRNAAWMFLMLKLMGLQLQGTDHILTSNRWVPWFAFGITLVPLILFGAAPLAKLLPPNYDLSLYPTFSIWLAMSIGGLLLLEQFFRYSNEGVLWATKHLCLGLGIVFAFDFFMYAEALLFRRLDRELWQARGIISAMAALLIAMSISRTDTSSAEDNADGIHLSRHLAFHSLTLMAAGIYLITMALAGYFIGYLGGRWSGVLQIVFLCAAGLTLVVLLFSGQIRARARVWLSKHFFSYKYDYRLEWLQFTQMLASGNTHIPVNIIRAVANLAKSPAGILWSRADDGRFNIVANWEMAPPDTDIDLGDLSQWLQKFEWLIDVREWRTAPDVYRNLKLPEVLTSIYRAWLIIPLFFGNRLQGILLLRESDQLRDLNWEDRDLLKLAGKQAASHLAQFEADQALGESRQFEAFNRLSAYVIHDLKNVLAQLSLIVTNAQKHKRNPEFIDDMVDTVSNTVNRMTKLMTQLRGGTQQTEHHEINLAELLENVLAESQLRTPIPELILEDRKLTLACDWERLQTVFAQLVQNAQEATDKNGHVTVRLLSCDGSAVVEIEDNGTGMDEQFIQHRLFKPFDSTKGLTGMGIGAFESRDFIRGLGGNVSVHSSPGRGTVFRVRIPCMQDAELGYANSLHKVNIL